VEARVWKRHRDATQLDCEGKSQFSDEEALQILEKDSDGTKIMSTKEFCSSLITHGFAMLKIFVPTIRIDREHGMASNGFGHS